MNGDWLESHAAPDVPQAASIDDVKPSARSTTFAATTAPNPPSLPPPPEELEVWALSDVHSDLVRTKEALQLTGLVDKDMKWLGKNAILVQTGDLTERGDDTKGLMDMFISLSDDMTEKGVGDRLVNLLGNHDVWSLKGYWSYVQDSDIDGFPGDDEYERKLARAKAFAYDGKYGEFLRKHGKVCYIPPTEGAKTLFVHGGLSPFWADKAEGDCETLNQMAVDKMETVPTMAEIDKEAKENPDDCDAGDHCYWTERAFKGDEYDKFDEGIFQSRGPPCNRKVDEGSSVTCEGAGPVWYRGFSQGTYEQSDVYPYTKEIYLKNITEVCAMVDESLEKMGAQRMAVGHTIVHDGQARAFCDNKYIMADIAMTRGYNGDYISSGYLDDDDAWKELTPKRVLATKYHPWDGASTPLFKHPDGYWWTAPGAPLPPLPPSPPPSPPSPPPPPAAPPPPPAAPGLKYLANVGNDDDDSTHLGLCEGDCDSDDDCMGDLKCFQHTIIPPGCIAGNEKDGWDYCG